jgi:hypothetical protein
MKNTPEATPELKKERAALEDIQKHIEVLQDAAGLSLYKKQPLKRLLNLI